MWYAGHDLNESTSINWQIKDNKKNGQIKDIMESQNKKWGLLKKSCSITDEELDYTSRLFYTSQCVAFELMFLKQFFSQGETKLQCNNSHTSSVIKLRKPCYYMMYAPKF